MSSPRDEQGRFRAADAAERIDHAHGQLIGDIVARQSRTLPGLAAEPASDATPGPPVGMDGGFRTTPASITAREGARQRQASEHERFLDALIPDRLRDGLAPEYDPRDVARD